MVFFYVLIRDLREVYEKHYSWHDHILTFIFGPNSYLQLFVKETAVLKELTFSK